MESRLNSIHTRFRQHLPVVVDVETGGINPRTDALLEIATVFLDCNPNGQWFVKETIAFHVLPFEGARLDPSALEFNKIDPYHPFRFAVSEKEALTKTFAAVEKEIAKAGCQRAMLVGHNAWFDLLFVKEAAHRSHLKIPFHAFTTLDTATLAALAFGQTVLAKAMYAAGIAFDPKEAHSAIYDAEKTAHLFCYILNNTKPLL